MGRRPTRARTMEDAKPFKVPIQPKLLQWLDELQAEAENLAKDSDSEDEEADGAKDEEEEGKAKNKKAAAAAKGGKAKTRRDEIVEEGSKLPGVGDPQVMARKYKGWDQSGKGGFGTVYMTKDTGGKQLVAVKVMPHKSVKEQQTNFTEVYFLNMLRHPNIVSYYNSFVLPEEIWVAMEFLQGGTLSDACKARQFQEEEVAFTARELLQGVKYMHDHNLAHRDIKSPNVMLSTSAEVKLIDFGLTRDLSDLAQTHMVGSPYWMPPEMIKKEPHGLPVDIWSSGICVLELMNGKPPNRDNSLKAMFLVGIGEAPGPATNKWSLECVKFVEAMLTISQTERPTCKAMLEHSFLKKAATNQVMQKMLQQIFLSQTFGGDKKGGVAGIF